MIRRLYVHNFRCFENFDLAFADKSSVLLVGPNGAGKTTLGFVLRLLQSIGRGTNQVKDLVGRGDFAQQRSNTPMRFRIEVDLEGVLYIYEIAFELPKTFRELRVLEESLIVEGSSVFHRERASVTLSRQEQGREAKFQINWHLVALPIVEQQSADAPLNTFKRWLSQLIVLRPVPSLIKGQSEEETLFPDDTALNFAAWFSGLVAHAPSAYTKIEAYLRTVMPDFLDIKNPETGTSARSLSIQFSGEAGTLSLPFDALSDGEKCFMIASLVIAANEVNGPACCFWDEPDHFLSLQEVGGFVMALRRTFHHRGQLITTSHNPEAIRQFADDNTVLLARKSHLEPTTARFLDEIEHSGELVSSLIRGDLLS